MIEYQVTSRAHDISQAYDVLFQNEPVCGLVDWRLEGPGGGARAVIATEGGRIVGLSSYLGCNMRVSGQPIRAYQAVDSMVAADQRGRGIFTRLARVFAETQSESGFELIWGFPNQNAAPVWFGPLGWTRISSAPYLVRPLRASYVLRRLSLSFDIPISRLKDHGAQPITSFNETSDRLWDDFSGGIDCAVSRSSKYLNWRLFKHPRSAYRVASFNPDCPTAYVASTTFQKWGGKVAYVLEAIGSEGLADLLRSELGRLREAGTEVAIAWCYPHSPNYRAYRAAGFFPLPERLRPVVVHVGCRPYGDRADAAKRKASWYISYLDADTM